MKSSRFRSNHVTTATTAVAVEQALAGIHQETWFVIGELCAGKLHARFYAMQRGYYMPNRNSRHCSRHQCPYWRRCEQDFGGVVEA